MPESQMPEFPERKQCVSQVVGRCFCRNENRYPTFTYGRGHLRLFYAGKDRSLPRNTPGRTTSCLNLSGFPHAQYVQPHTGHTQSHPTAICTHTHPMLAADIVSPGAHIASQTANARLAAPNMHSTNQRLSFLPNTNPRTISAKPSKAANTIIQKPMF